ncbi:MAG: FAD-dependent oxidoreductase [Thermaerobacter sp.]|nr:FAD-dependent oxidoreductase [Thermaerobacter sp.]
MSEAVLIIGGGPAGLAAAASLADLGVEAVLVEKEPELGGTPKKYAYSKLVPDLRPAQETLAPLVQRVQGREGLRVLTDARPTAVSGKAGDFKVRLTGPAGEEELSAGAIIVATGFEHFDARRDTKYGYGIYPDVVDIRDMERMLSEPQLKRPSDGQVPQRVGFILCVGSRDRMVGNTYCSRVCCSVCCVQAIEVKEKNPAAEVYIFYMDIRTYGLLENLYWEAQEEHGVLFVKGRVGEILPRDGQLMVKGEDTLLRGPFEVPFDLMVLASGMEPGEGTVQVAELLNLAREPNGFLAPRDSHTAPLEAAVEGVFLAGADLAPKFSDDAVAEGAGAAVRAAAFLRSRAGR